MRLILLLLLTGLARADLDTAPLEAWLSRQTEVKSLEAEFTQERRLPALRNPVRTEGTLSMARPGKLRWELGKPAKTIAVSDGTTMTLVDVAKGRARTLPADSAKARQFTLLADGALRGDLEGFKATFELVESRVTRGIYQLTTRPKERGLRQHVSWVYLDIDPQKNELRALELQLEDKSRIRTIFTRTRINPDLPAGRFEVDLSGYTVR
jgi:outer membrane lipoprotein carrier protein